MGKQSGNTSFDQAKYKRFLRFEAMEAEAEAEAKVEAPKKRRGRPAKGTTTAKKVANEAIFTMLKGGKWVPTGGKGSAHFNKKKDAGVVLRCDNPDGRITIWNGKTGVTL
tara:strand:+ start:481 stop:810 length:330 start_codon:yes stop_codon:yes gene_type:complete